MCAWCAQGLWFLTLKLGIGFLVETKKGLMSNISIFDCNIPFLKLHPPFSRLNRTADIVLCGVVCLVFFSMLTRAMTVQPERKIRKDLAFL